MTRFAVIALLGLVTTLANAEPLPYPKPRDGQCAGSYVQSGGFCVPKSGGTVKWNDCPLSPTSGTKADIS